LLEVVRGEESYNGISYDSEAALVVLTVADVRGVFRDQTVVSQYPEQVFRLPLVYVELKLDCLAALVSQPVGLAEVEMSVVADGREDTLDSVKVSCREYAGSLTREVAALDGTQSSKVEGMLGDSAASIPLDGASDDRHGRSSHDLSVVDVEHLPDEVKVPIVTLLPVKGLKCPPGSQNAKSPQRVERHGGLEEVDRQALEERALVAISDEGTVPVAYNRIGGHDVSAMISKSWVRASFSEGDYITWEEGEERWRLQSR
jgi:hypothetical protein